jgi:uncharacterized RDD family membrane protein YckC
MSASAHDGNGTSSHSKGIASRVIGAVVGPLVSPVVDHVDVDEVVQRVDMDEVLERVDINQLLDRIDVNRVLERVDLNRVLERVDLNKVLERVDTDALVERTELGAVIARSTGGVVMIIVDAARSVSVSMDQVVHGAIDRILRRKVHAGDDDGVSTVKAGKAGLALQGHVAGMISRLFAFLIDVFVAGLLFLALQTLLRITVEVVTGNSFNITDHRIIYGATAVVWAFVYFAVPVAVAGRTVGMAVLGLRVARREGGVIDPRHAVIRTLALPLSFLLLGVGLLLGVVRRDHRCLHDLIADTSVRYAWDARAARLRSLAASSPAGSPVAGSPVAGSPPVV